MRRVWTHQATVAFPTMTTSRSNIRTIAEFLVQSIEKHKTRTDCYVMDTYNHYLQLWEYCIHNAKNDEDIPIVLGNRICALFDEWKRVLTS